MNTQTPERIKLSIAESNAYAGFEQQKKQIDNQMISLTHSVLETRGIDYKKIQASVSLSEDYKELIILVPQKSE